MISRISSLLQDMVDGHRLLRPARSLEPGALADILITQQRGLSLGFGTIDGQAVILPGTRLGELVRAELTGHKHGSFLVARPKERLRKSPEFDQKALFSKRQRERFDPSGKAYAIQSESKAQPELKWVEWQADPRGKGPEVRCPTNSLHWHGPAACGCLKTEGLGLIEEWISLHRVLDDSERAGQSLKFVVAWSVKTGEYLLGVDADSKDPLVHRWAAFLHGRFSYLVGVLSIKKQFGSSKSSEKLPGIQDKKNLLAGRSYLLHRSGDLFLEVGLREIKASLGSELLAGCQRFYGAGSRPVLVWCQSVEPEIFELAKKIRFLYWIGLSTRDTKIADTNAIRNGIHGLHVLATDRVTQKSMIDKLPVEKKWAGLLIVIGSGSMPRIPLEIEGRKWERLIIAGPWSSRLAPWVRRFRQEGLRIRGLRKALGSAGWAGALLMSSPSKTRRIGLRNSFLGLVALAFGLTMGSIANRPKSQTENQTPVMAQPYPSLGLRLGNDRLLRYEMLPVKGIVQGIREKSELHVDLEVLRNGQLVSGVGGGTRWRLKRESTGKFSGNWPVPFGAKTGQYEARLRVEDSQSKVWISPSTSFRIQGRNVSGSFAGGAAMTIELTRSSFYDTLPGPAGEPPGPQNVVSWARYMGSNTVWQCVGITTSWRTGTGKRAWDPGLLRSVNQIGPLLQEAGLQHGVWIQAFAVLGGVPDLETYQVAYRYDEDRDRVIPTRHISYNDEGRIQEIVALIRRLDANPTVNLIGLDYMRLGFGGYELVEEFVNEMGITLPRVWAEWTPNSRMKWLASHVEVERDKNLLQKWNWWRAHRTALVVKEIMDRAAPSKPVWVFTLGWRQGREHGQDPRMLMDAGISFSAVMLYEVDRPSFVSMKNDWRNYFRSGSFPMFIGQIVDWNLLQKTQNPPGPLELKRRLLEPLDAWWPSNPRVGLFWHDLTRAIRGRIGPYSTKEWVVAGAAAFSTARQKSGDTPLKGTWIDPFHEMARGRPGVLLLENEGTEPLFDVTVRRLDLENMDQEFLDGRRMPNMEPGRKNLVSRWAGWDEEMEDVEPLALVVTFRIGDRKAPLRRETFFIYKSMPSKEAQTAKARWFHQLDKGDTQG